MVSELKSLNSKKRHASSSSRIWGRCIERIENATRLFWPPESVPMVCRLNSRMSTPIAADSMRLSLVPRKAGDSKGTKMLAVFLFAFARKPAS